MNINLQKKSAAQAAVDYIDDGMIVGLGTGSTANYFIEALSKKIKAANWHLTCVTTSTKSQQLAESLGIHVVSIDDIDHIDVTVDGVDEFDPQLNGIKGGGAALLFEKIVALNSKKNIWIVDTSKKSDKLGSFLLPIEIIPFGSVQLFTKLSQMNLQPQFRVDDQNRKVLTDSKNYIIDVDISHVTDIHKLADTLKSLTGIVEHGLFLDLCHTVIIGGKHIEKIDR